MTDRLKEISDAGAQGMSEQQYTVRYWQQETVEAGRWWESDPMDKTAALLMAVALKERGLSRVEVMEKYDE